jgi:hypothetical protein
MSSLQFDTFDRDAAGQLIVDPAEADAQRQAVAPAQPLQLADVLPAAPGAVAPVRDVRTRRAWLTWVLAAACAGTLGAVLLRQTPSTPVRADVQPTHVPTATPATQPTPTAQPLGRAVVARFDYQDGDTEPHCRLMQRWYQLVPLTAARGCWSRPPAGHGCGFGPTMHPTHATCPI